MSHSALLPTLKTCLSKYVHNLPTILRSLSPAVILNTLTTC